MYKRRSKPDDEPRSNLGIIAKSGCMGCAIPAILGLVYGLLFLDNWNVLPAFIIVGCIIGFVIGAIVGAIMALFSK